MTTPIRPLSTLRPGEAGRVDHLDLPADVGLKLMEMGMGIGEKVIFLRQAPFGGPIEIELMGFRMALRNSEAEKIFLHVDSNAHHENRPAQPG